MSTRFRSLLLAGVLTLAVFATAAGAGLTDQTYPDAQGDAVARVDITSVAVRNDHEGNISIQLRFAEPLRGSYSVDVYIDQDKNQATGSEGDEVRMEAGVFVSFSSWNGVEMVASAPPGFSIGTPSPNVMEFRVNRASLGNTSSFNFSALSLAFDATIDENNPFPLPLDSAPNIGDFTYDLVFPQCGNGLDDDGDGKVDTADLGCSSAADENEADDPVNVKLGAAKTAPAKPRPGKTAVVSAAATRVETGQPLDGGTVKCTAKIVGGAALKGAGSMVAGRATCKFKIPVTAKNKQVRGQIAVAYQTASAKVPFVFRTAAA